FGGKPKQGEGVFPHVGVGVEDQLFPDRWQARHGARRHRHPVSDTAHIHNDPVGTPLPQPAPKHADHPGTPRPVPICQRRWVVKVCRHVTATARASATSSGRGTASRPSRVRIIYPTCRLAARPCPVTASLISRGVYSWTGMPLWAAHSSTTPRAWPTA